jgi:SPP1 gp7 family putative phage head morphogenesis protein
LKEIAIIGHEPIDLKKLEIWLMPKIPKGIRALGTVGKRAINVALLLYRKQTNQWIKDVKSQMDSYDDFDKLELTPLSDKIRNTIERTLLLSYLMGNGFAEEDKEIIERQERQAEFIVSFVVKRQLPEKQYSFAIVTGIDWRITGFDAALQLLKRKTVIPAKVFKAASAWIKSIAFSVQRLEDLNAIRLIKESIKSSIDSGVVFRDWKNMVLPDIFKKAGYIRSKALELTPWHLETIFRTNQASVYNSARFENFMRDRNVAAIEYRAVLDDRTRPEHESLDGFIAPKDAPIWGSIYPPNGYNCRCTVVPVTRYGLQTGRQKISLIDDKIKDAVRDVHPDFQGKANLKAIDARLKKVEASKIKEIDEIKI